MADKNDAIPPPTDFIYNQSTSKMVKEMKKEVEKIKVDELPQGLPEEGLPGHPVESHECTEEAVATRKVLKTCPNSGDKSKGFDPNFVVLALPCQNSRRAAAPGRVAAEASFVRPKNSKWCPPPPGVYKINFHGFSFSEFGDAGIGIVVRDYKGDVIAAMSRKVKYGSFTQSIDALAISLGLCFGHDLGLTRVFIEGDSAILKTRLCSKTSSPLPNKESIEKYEFCKFSFVKEEANLVAHKLACYAVRVEDFIVWMEDPPDFLVNTLAWMLVPLRNRSMYLDMVDLRDYGCCIMGKIWK